MQGGPGFRAPGTASAVFGIFYVQRGRENSFYTFSQARGDYQPLQKIRGRADWGQRSGRFNSEDIEMRLPQFRESLHAAREYHSDRHNQAHRRQNFKLRSLLFPKMFLDSAFL